MAGGIVLGDKVRFRSQSHGNYKTKTGTVVVVVPRHTNPLQMDTVKKMCLCYEYGSMRDHESYMVRVGYRVYWPRVKHLRKLVSIPAVGSADMDTHKIDYTNRPVSPVRRRECD